MRYPCEVTLSARFVTSPGFDWSSGERPAVVERLAWPNGCEPAPALRERVERLAAWTRAFVARYRGISLYSLTIAGPGEPPPIEVLVVRDDIGGADDETMAARAALRALRREAATLAAGVSFVGEYVK